MEHNSSPALQDVLDEVSSSCDWLDEQLSRMAQELRTTVLRLARDRDVQPELADRLRVIARDAAEVRDRKSA